MFFRRIVLPVVGILSIIGLLCVVFLFYQFYPPLQSELSMGDSDLRVAVWMGVTWSMDEYSTNDIEQLARDLATRQVDDLYVYVSYLKAGDFFNPTYDHAQTFVESIKRVNPELRVLAWIGVPISITQPDGTYVSNRLESEIIRQQIADFSAMTVMELGFDGVHLNAELIPNGDPAFIETLKRIQETLPEDAYFSATAHALRLNEPFTSIPYPTIDHHWTPDYLRDVAQQVDQIALMAYDSGLLFPRDYLHWMTYQVQASQQTLAESDVELIIGLPTSEEWSPSHQTQAETVLIALNGIVEGDNGRIDGIGVYPYWDTDETEWQSIINSLYTP